MLVTAIETLLQLYSCIM